MGFVAAQEKVVSKAWNSGPRVTASVQPGSKAAPNRMVVVLTLNGAAQRRLFGSELDPDQHRIKVLRGDGGDTGLVQVELDPEGFAPIRSARGSVKVKLWAWANCPRQPRKAAQCAIVEKVGLSATIALPWKGENHP